MHSSFQNLNLMLYLFVADRRGRFYATSATLSWQLIDSKFIDQPYSFLWSLLSLGSNTGTTEPVHYL